MKVFFWFSALLKWHSNSLPFIQYWEYWDCIPDVHENNIVLATSAVLKFDQEAISKRRLCSLYAMLISNAFTLIVLVLIKAQESDIKIKNPNKPTE